MDTDTHKNTHTHTRQDVKPATVMKDVEVLLVRDTCTQFSVINTF